MVVCLYYNLELRWDGVPSLADAMRMLREQAQRTPPNHWVRVVGGWSEYQFAEKRMPALDELNAAAPDTPVFVLNLYANALLNRAALRAAGYTKDTPNPPGGEIHGGPALVDSGQQLVFKRRRQERCAGAGTARGYHRAVGGLLFDSGRTDQGAGIGADDSRRQNGLCRGRIQGHVATAVAGQSRMVAGRHVWRLRRTVVEKGGAALARRNGIVQLDIV